MGKAPGWSGGRRQEAGGHTYIGVSEGKAVWVRVNSLGLASWSNFGGLWTIWVVSSCLVPSPGITKAEEYFPPGVQGQIQEVWLWIG